MTITRVDSVVPTAPTGCLLDGAIDEPLLSHASDVYRIDVAGWALGRHDPIKTIEVYAGRVRLVVASVSDSRPDIAELYPNVRWALPTGFRTAVSVLGFPGQFEFQVVVVTADGQRSTLGAIKGQRAALPMDSADSAPPFPLLVTTVGRSGSTWLMRLINNHPKVVAHRPFQRDTRVAAYWLGVLDTLGYPGSYLLPLETTTLADPRWWIGSGNLSTVGTTETRLAEWLGRENVEDLAAFCRRRIVALYERIADGERATEYVAEKVVPNLVPFLAWDLFPKMSEIVLVRDFRDMFCSMVAYTERFGYQHFGRDHVATEEEYVLILRSHARDLLQSWMQRKDYAALVRYEELVTDPHKCIFRLLEQCNLDRSDHMVDGMIKASLPADAREAEHRTVADPALSVGRWKRDLSPALQELCEEAFGDALSGFGYK